MNLETIQMLYDYNYWAHRCVWNECVMALTDEQFARDLDYSWGSVHRQVVHVMSAEWIWFSRLRGTSPDSMFSPADYPTRAAVRARWDTIEEDVRSYLQQLDPVHLGQIFRYKTTKSLPKENRVQDILLHVVNHGTDHRAQILAMIHRLGGNTLEQDLIFYLRQ